MNDWMGLVESGRSIWTSRLGPAEGIADWKFALGDLIADLSDDQLHAFVPEITTVANVGPIRSYREVAKAWPIDKRVDASWTAHRTLAKADDRFDLIRPGMTLRQAQEALGKQPSDTEHPRRWPVERRIPFIIDQLQDDETAKAVREQLDERKRTRSAKAAVRMVEEDRSAEYREALRQLREARDAKHPERAAYDALFKVREAVEYLRAVGKASSGENSFLPTHMRPSLVAAVRDLARVSVDVIAALSEQEVEAREALDTLSVHLDGMLKEKQQPAVFDNVVIFGEVGPGQY